MKMMDQKKIIVGQGQRKGVAKKMILLMMMREALLVVYFLP
jgi:hypothetical protein